MEETHDPMFIYETVIYSKVVHYGDSRSLNVVKVLTNQKPLCNFMSMSSSNLSRISYRLWDIVMQRSEICIFAVFTNPSDTWSPCDLLCEIYSKKAKIPRLSDGQNHMIQYSFVSIQYLLVTDRQMDRALTAINHIMSTTNLL